MSERTQSDDDRRTGHAGYPARSGPGEQRTLSRRRALVGLAGTTLMLAGCLGGGDDDASNDSPADGASDDGQPDEGENGIVLDEVVLNTGFPIQLVQVGTEAVRTEVHYHDSEFQHWHDMPLSIPEGETEQFRIRIVDPQREPISLGPDAPLQLQVTDAGAPPGLADITVDGERITVTGNRPGEGEYDVALLENDERVLDIDPLVVRVE